MVGWLAGWQLAAGTNIFSVPMRPVQFSKDLANQHNWIEQTLTRGAVDVIVVLEALDVVVVVVVVVLVCGAKSGDESI